MGEVAAQGMADPPRGPVRLLRRKVALNFIVLVLGACSIAAVLLFSRASRERQSIRDRALATATALSFGFDQEVAAVHYLLKGLSASPALRSGDIRALYDQLLATPVPEGSWLVYHDLEKQVINTLRPFGSPLPRNAEFANYREQIERIRDRRWSVSGRLFGIVRGSTTVALSLRIDGPDGQMSNYITTVLSDTRLNTLLAEQAVPAGWAKALYDRTLLPIVGEKGGRKTLEVPAPATLRARLADADPGATVDGFVESAEDNGIPVLVAFRRSGPTNWTTIVQVPLSVVDAPVTGLLWQMAGAAALLLCAGGLAALFTSRQVERPLQTLSRRVTEAESEVTELSSQLLTLQEEERQRIARELHDSTAQRIVAASLGLAKLEREIGANRGAREALADVDALHEQALAELRTFTYLLHPPNLAEEGLCATLETFIDGFARRTGLRGQIRVDPEVDDLPPDVQRSLLRVVQEALANVHRHAAATEVHVGARLAGGRVVLRVRDNGRGMAAPGPDLAAGRLGLGVGIPGMRARLRQFGGDLRIKTGPRGTALRAFVPARIATAAVERPRRGGWPSMRSGPIIRV